MRGAALLALEDRIALRDPAGRTAHPHLVAAYRGGEAGLLARGPFLIHARYEVTPEEGARFCRATGDDNVIHFAGDVVPGAMTAAKVLLPLEVLFPELELASVTVKFTAIARYGRALFLQIRGEPDEKGARFRAKTTEEGAPIAEIEIAAVRAVPQAAVAAAAFSRRKVNVERLRAVRTFLQTLHVVPHAYFRRASTTGYFYPRAFLASLPSGAMVRQLRGEGGLLNKLSLEFETGLRVPIAGREDLSVAIERPKARRTFNKILTAIGDSIRTYVRGTALVLSRDGSAAGAGSLREDTGTEGAAPSGA